MHAMQLNSAEPIVYTDQKKKKILVVPGESVLFPSNLSLEDKYGNRMIVPVQVHGNMLSMDIESVKAGSYFVRIAGLSELNIRVILF